MKSNFDFSKVKVEKKVKIPKIHNFKNPLSAIMAKMKIGESFELPCSEINFFYGARTTLYHHDKSFSLRKITKDKYRIWRVG